MVNVNPFNLIGANVTAPPAPGYNRSTRVTAPNGHYLDFASDVTWGLFADGMPWFINDGVAITGRFPAGRNFGGNNIDGYTLNPTMNGPQGLDQRRQGYVAPAAINTITPRKMDLILSVESEETSTIGGGNIWRDGYFKTNGQAWFTCLTRPPAAGTFSPTVHWPGDDVSRLNRPMRVPDVDGMLARLPSYSSAGITSPPTWSSFAGSFNQPNGAWLHYAYGSGQGWVDAVGFGGGMPRGFGGAITDNWGQYVANEMNRAMAAAVLDHWSTADKRAFLVRLLQHGNQWIEPFNGLPARSIPASGGQHQWHWTAAAAWLDATGQNARSTALLNTFPGNLEQVFAVTAYHVANDLVRHNDNTKPYPYRDRSIVAPVSGLNFKLQSYGGVNELSDGPNPNFNGLVMTRVSDGDTSRITAFNDAFDTTAETQASPVWAEGDLVYFVPGFTITAGQLQWSLTGPGTGAALSNKFNPSPDASYLGLQSPATQILFLRALGIVAPEWENFADFWALCAAGNYPAAAPYAYPDPRKTTLEIQVWNAHFGTANAVPSRF